MLNVLGHPAALSLSLRRDLSPPLARLDDQKFRHCPEASAIQV